MITIKNTLHGLQSYWVDPPYTNSQLIQKSDGVSIIRDLGQQSGTIDARYVRIENDRRITSIVGNFIGTWHFLIYRMKNENPENLMRLQEGLELLTVMEQDLREHGVEQLSMISIPKIAKFAVSQLGFYKMNETELEQTNLSAYSQSKSRCLFLAKSLT